MSDIQIIVIGSLKEQSYKEIEHHYLKQIKKPGVIIHELKSLNENIVAEAELVLKKFDQLSKNCKTHLVALTEHASCMNSIKFSNWLSQHLSCNYQLCFVIGGASGLNQELLSRANETLSLSPLTFPHKMARLLLIEQIYRAQTIRTAHPYHK